MRLRLGLPALVLVLAAGCSDDHDRAPAKAQDAQRTMLSEGYSLLYSDASHVDLVELALYVKFDSKEFNDLIRQISDYAGGVKHELERIAHDYPGVRIDLKPLPEMETRKRFAIAKDRMIRFAPLGGHSRQEYERTMLISMSNALNHESHLCRVMAAEEPDAGLKKFLLGSEKGYADLYEVVMKVLDREYFRRSAPARKKA